jgi:hypothetical protein
VISWIKGGSYTVDVKDQSAKGNMWNVGLKDGWKELHNEELLSLHSLLKILRENESRKVLLLLLLLLLLFLLLLLEMALQSNTDLPFLN